MGQDLKPELLDIRDQSSLLCVNKSEGEKMEWGGRGEAGVSVTVKTKNHSSINNLVRLIGAGGGERREKSSFTSSVINTQEWKWPQEEKEAEQQKTEMDFHQLVAAGLGHLSFFHKLPPHFTDKASGRRSCWLLKDVLEDSQPDLATQICKIF